MMDFGHILTSDGNSLTEVQFREINQLFSSIKDIFANERTERLPIALGYYKQAFRPDINPSVRYLGLMMAMEALFGNVGSEIAHQVSERTAFFLKQTPEDREHLFDSMKHHYSLRSKIAHGGAPNNKRETTESFKRLLRTLSDSLIRILENPAYLELFVSNDTEKFNKAMRGLIFLGMIRPAS